MPKCDDKLPKKKLIECLAPHRRVTIDVTAPKVISQIEATKTPLRRGFVPTCSQRRRPCHDRSIDLLIRARWIIPVEPADAVLEHHALAVRDGRIVALLPGTEAVERYTAGREITLDRHALMPASSICIATPR